MTDRLLSQLKKDPAVSELLSGLRKGRGPAAVFSLPDAARAPVFATLSGEGTTMVVLDTEAAAIELFNEIRIYRPDALPFLPRELPLVHVQAAAPERRSQRLGVLSRLVLGVPTLIVTCAAALMERLAPPEAFVSQVKVVKRGDVLPPRTLLADLVSAGYERVDMLEGPGQAALRGDILDVFPPQGEDPCRIEFFDDEVDQLRWFDVATQRSIRQTDRVLLPPAFETPQPGTRVRKALKALGEREGFDREREDWADERPTLGADVLLPLLYEEEASLDDYLPRDCLRLVVEPDRVLEEGRTGRMLFLESVTAMLERGEGHPQQAKLLREDGHLVSALNTARTGAVYALFRTSRSLEHRMRVKCTLEGAPMYLGDMGELARELKRFRQSGGSALLYGGESADSLLDSLQDELRCAIADELNRDPEPGEVLILRESLPRGFLCPAQKLMVLTGAELFGKRMSRPRKKKSGLKFSDLSVGDYVVHEAHGIGRFVGVEQLTVQNSTRDYLLLLYKGGDKLYIPTDQLDRIQKYMGSSGEDAAPTLSKLGGGEWQQKVQKARTAAKKLAVDLAALYAKRASLQGFAFSPDTAWQRKLEASFPYEETRDQLRCIREVKADMESRRPMDRLLCGDVGYGKTEVAIRAAFKAIQDGKQAAILAPTTILAQQHYATISERFAAFPVTVGCLSRFQTPKEREAVKKALAAGELDMVVGTHALLAKDVKFKDLGLLIIDEEHRFGVNHKEQIKAMRSQVLRREPQGADQGHAQPGGRADHDRHAHPPDAEHGHDRGQGRVRHRDAAGEPVPGPNLRGGVHRRPDRRRHPPGARPGRPVLPGQQQGHGHGEHPQPLPGAGARSPVPHGPRADERARPGTGHAVLHPAGGGRAFVLHHRGERRGHSELQYPGGPGRGQAGPCAALSAAGPGGAVEPHRLCLLHRAPEPIPARGGPEASAGRAGVHPVRGRVSAGHAGSGDPGRREPLRGGAARASFGCGL